MPKKKPLDKCPYCGNDEFYRNGTVSGKYQANYKFDGSVGDNTELHTGVRYHEHKTCYCANCNRKLYMDFPVRTSQ
jgi:hypothetical protein